VLCRSPARPGTIINTRPRCLRPRGNDRLLCYYFYQSSLAMTAPLWQRPPHVTLLLSMPARDVCALVATTASRAIIISKAHPDDFSLWRRPPIIIKACPGLLRTSGTDCLALLPAGWHSQVLHHQPNRKLACYVCAFVARPHSHMLFLSSISAEHTMICSGCPIPLRTSISSFAFIIRPVLPTGHNTSGLLSTVHHRRHKITRSRCPCTNRMTTCVCSTDRTY
jgi:hypothetical protein